MSGDPAPAGKGSAGEHAQVTLEGDGLASAIRVGGHVLAADEPADAGGANAGPTPVELALAALGACTSITAQMYAKRKGWPLESVRVDVRRETEAGEPGTVKPLSMRVELVGDLTDEQRERICTIANRCPVHRMLGEATEIRSDLIEGD